MRWERAWLGASPLFLSHGRGAGRDGSEALGSAHPGHSPWKRKSHVISAGNRGKAGANGGSSEHLPSGPPSGAAAATDGHRHRRRHRHRHRLCQPRGEGERPPGSPPGCPQQGAALDGAPPRPGHHPAPTPCWAREGRRRELAEVGPVVETQRAQQPALWASQWVTPRALHAVPSAEL